jgi:hypothetical protein
MQSYSADVANTLYYDVVNRTTGQAIQSGTVTAFLRALTGANAGKWFRVADGTWQDAESSAGTMTFGSQARWEISISGIAWQTGVRYEFYASESGNLHFPYTDEALEIHPQPVILQEETTVID